MTTLLNARRTGSAALLAILLGGQFMAVLDVSIVNVAVPSIRADLGASGAGLQLVVAGYTIAYAVLLVTGARLGDRWGHARAFRAGLAVFTAGSLLCGLAPATGALVAFRLLQGGGAALMVPQVFSLIQRTFTGPARARALGLYGAVLAGAATAGQVLGGLLTQADLLGTGWRPVFLLNVPVGLALLAFRLPDTPRTPVRFDWPGVSLLALSVSALVLPLVFGHEAGWPAWTWASLLLSAVLLAVFGTRRRSLLRVPGLVPAALAILATMAAYAGFLFTLGLHTQSDLGYGPARSGLILVPAAAAFAVSSLNWRRLPAAWHRRMVPVALLLTAVALAAQAWTLHAGHPIGVAYVTATVGYGFCLGAAFGGLLTFALARVAPAAAADASGAVATVTQLAQVIGVAAFGTLYLSTGGPSAAALTDVALAGAAGLAAGFALLLPRA